MNRNIKIISENITYFKLVSYRSLPNKYKHLSEDLAQDAIEKAIQKIHLYNPNKGSFKSWLYRLTQNLCIDAVRKLDKLDIVPIHFYNHSITEKDSLDFEVLKRKKKYVRKAISQLSDRDKKIIIARFLFNLSGKEMANLLDIPEKQIYVYLSRAKLKLKSLCNAA